MVIIIITALASIFLTVVVGLLIWSTISVCKLKKHAKSNSSEIDNLKKTIEDQYDLIQSLNNQNHEEMGKIVKRFNDQISDREQDLRRELDKRFDKVYNLISNDK